MGLHFLNVFFVLEGSPPFHGAALLLSVTLDYYGPKPSCFRVELEVQMLKKCTCIRAKIPHSFVIGNVRGGDELQQKAKHLCRRRGWAIKGNRARERFGETQNYGVVSLRCMCISLTFALLVPHGSKRVWDRSNLAQNDGNMST